MDMRSRTGVVFKSFVLAALSTVAIASPATASVTLGQLAPGSSPPDECLGPGGQDVLQPTVTSGNTYVVPGTGTITSWKHNAAGSSSGVQRLTLKVFRKVADPATYMAVGHDGPRDLIPGNVTGYPASIPVKAGDVLGVSNNFSPGSTACWFYAPFESFLFDDGNLADGDFKAFISSAHTSIANERVNVSAVFEPSNSLTLGKVKRNEKKGTATLTVEVPNPGELTGSGNGVKAASAGEAVTSKAVTAPGEAQLLIKAKGKKRRKLNETGKVKLNVNVTYTPTGGDPKTQLTKVKLRKNV
jgi:hypothetical protein